MPQSPAALIQTAGRDHPPRDANAWRFALWAVLYATIVAYGSLVIGPFGWHFVPHDPYETWRQFLATPFFDNASDQRPDWIANLLMTIPLGFLTAGALASARGPTLRITGSVLALIIGVVFVLALKYAQLYFPPRTVSLNYIIAQSIGVCAGVAALPLVRTWQPRQRATSDPLTPFKRLLDALIIAFVVLALFPFDLVLSASDLQERISSLPAVLFALPGPGRSPAARLLLISATASLAIPLGMRLAVRNDHPGLPRIAAIGFGWMTALFLASTLILSATPSLATLAGRVVGVVIGAIILRSLTRLDLVRARVMLARFIPLWLLLYVVSVAAAQGLLRPPWQRPYQALATIDLRGLLPFFYYYIVSKAHAMQSIAAHAAIYAPVGPLLWLRHGGTRGMAWAAGCLAAVLAVAIEFGRALHPGVQPDINAVIVAAVAAAIACRAMPMVWDALLALPMASGQPALSELAAAQTAALESVLHRPHNAARSHAMPLALRIVLATPCAAGAVALAAYYPLSNWIACAALIVWAAILCWRPGAWLVLLPAVVVALDLAPWTGWLVTSEADIAVLATVAVLLLRAPPSSRDLWPRGPAGIALALAVIACAIGVARGLTAPFVIEGGTDNPYLQPLNALRLAKPFVEMLALMPFLLNRQRRQGDAITLFGHGMLISLIAVGLAAAAERAAFIGLFDVTSDYRAVATFSSMHIGGGHIGAFLAFALPFIAICLHQMRPWRLLILLAAAMFGGYALVFTFARTAYAAACVALLTTACGWTAAHYRRGRRASAAAGLVIAGVAAVVVAAGISTPYMDQRLNNIVSDFARREANWATGLALPDDGLTPLLLGMGTGTYPRIAALNSPSDEQPGGYSVVNDGRSTFLRTRFGPAFYFGQKVHVSAGATYTLQLDVKASQPGAALSAGLCNKLLLYSSNCQTVRFTSGDSWTHVSATLRAPQQQSPLPAPVEFWLATQTLDPIDVSHIELQDLGGPNILANGDFASGTDRWFFTSDHHTNWRIKDMGLATWFDGGVLAVAALVILLGSAIAGATRAITRGDASAAPLLGAFLAILVSGIFDDVFEAPRLALEYDLAILLGLAVGWPPAASRWQPRAARQ